MRQRESKETISSCEGTLSFGIRVKKKESKNRKKADEKDKKEEQKKKAPKRLNRLKADKVKSSTNSNDSLYKSMENSKEMADTENDDLPTPNTLEKLKGKCKMPTGKKRKEKKGSREEEEKTKELEKEKEEKRSKKSNMQLAQLFFKKISESQKSTRKTNVDKNLEVMPYFMPKISHSQGNRKKASSRHHPLDRSIFKETGEPVWVVPDRTEDVMTADGVMTKYPELMEALEEEGLKMDDGKQWAGMMEDFMAGQLDSGILDDGFTVDQLDPFDTFESLQKRSDKYFRIDSVVYYTMSNLLNLSKEAIERFFKKDKNTNAGMLWKDTENNSITMTAIVTSIIFNTNSICRVSYDRRGPIRSIQKCRKKYKGRLK